MEGAGAGLSALGRAADHLRHALSLSLCAYWMSLKRLLAYLQSSPQHVRDNGWRPGARTAARAHPGLTASAHSLLAPPISEAAITSSIPVEQIAQSAPKNLPDFK